MPTVTQDPDRPNIWHLELSSAEHGRLVSLGEQPGRKIASTAAEGLGLGRFVPVDTKPDGSPAANTRWRTSHRNRRAALQVLADALEDLLTPGRLVAMQAIVDAWGSEEPPGEAELAVRFRDARPGV